MKTLAERFWPKVKKRGPEECWEWAAYIDPQGYGRVRCDGETRLAHRVSYELHKGPIPDGMFACHHCDNRKCVNPKHLFVGRAIDNVRDMHRKGRQAPTSITARRGEAHGMCKLSPEEVVEIRSFKGLSQRDLARLFGVGQSQIQRIRAGESWPHI